MPANIQGLNIIQPQQADSQSQDLLSAQAFPDISAQLDLWTNLTFDTDEGSLSRPNDEKFHGKNLEEEEEDTESPTASGEKAVHDGHDNVVMATNLGSNISQPVSSPSGVSHLPAFDLNALLSGFNPYASLSQHANPGPASSLAQLLALHAHDQQFPTPMPNPFPHYPVVQSPYEHLPPVLDTPVPPASAPAPAPAPASTSAPFEEIPLKRLRTRKPSASSSEAPTADVQVMAIAAAEDKRRRNTAASARFRLKKKEREAALEGKAKELEARVSELERECEGLRRENGWLKGLVVGVTGAAQGPVVNSPPPSLSSSQIANLTSATASGKRSREDLDD